MGCRFDCAKGLIIGENSVINANCRIDSRGGLEIGSNVSISEDVVILTADHTEEFFEKEKHSKKVIIEDYVFIGTRAMILPCVKVGKGSIVAAGAVVTKNVDSLFVVAGIPAQKIKLRPLKLNYKANYKRFLQ